MLPSSMGGEAPIVHSMRLGLEGTGNKEAKRLGPASTQTSTRRTKKVKKKKKKKRGKKKGPGLWGESPLARG